MHTHLDKGRARETNKILMYPLRHHSKALLLPLITSDNISIEKYWLHFLCHSCVTSSLIVDSSEFIKRIFRWQGWPVRLSLKPRIQCVCVLPLDSGPAISSPTSPAEEVWTCPGQGGRGASHSAWLPADSNLHARTHTYTRIHIHSQKRLQGGPVDNFILQKLSHAPTQTSLLSH